MAEGTRKRKKNEFLYFALRNNKLKIGFAVVALFLVVALFGTLLTDVDPRAYIGPMSARPSGEYYIFCNL